MNFTFKSYALRLVASLFLVFLTYNPYYSYYQWVQHTIETGIEPFVVLAGISLLIGWVVFVRATIVSLGLVGLGLAMAFFGTFTWVLVYYNLIALNSIDVMSYVAEAILAMILATGMSWSSIRRRISGQVDVNSNDPTTEE